MKKDQIRNCQAALTVWLVIGLFMPVYALAEMQQTQPTKQPPGIGVEISTEDIKKVLSDKTEPVVDVRSPREYSIAHIPGSVNIYETEIDKMAQLLSDKKAGMIIYCNGPFCHKVKRVAEKLIKKGYPNIRRYQLGLPVWRAYGNTVQTDMEGFKYIFSGDKTAVFVDARDKQEFTKETIPGAVNVLAGEAETANTDGRLPYTDKGTRIIVFAENVEKARKVAAEIADKAFWNSSYFGGAFVELRQAGLW